jgi:hypothetical protein
MTGTMAVHKEVRTYTGHRISPSLGHVMAAEQESQRPLLTPDEALRLPQGVRPDLRPRLPPDLRPQDPLLRRTRSSRRA